MAGTVTVTSMSNPFACDGENKVVVDWIATSGGAADGALSALYSAAALAKFGYATPQPSKFRGNIVKCETIPGASGDLTTLLPTAAYNITLTDAYGDDVTAGALRVRSGTVAEQWVPSQPVKVDSELTLTISAAGDSKKGRVIIHLE